MAAAQRMTDANDGDGTISSVPQSTVYANSKLLSVNGSSVTTDFIQAPRPLTEVQLYLQTERPSIEQVMLIVVLM